MTDWSRQIRERLAGLSLQPEREVEIIEELSQHLDDQVRERTAGGVPLDQAREEALADLDAPGELARQLAATEVRLPLKLPPPGVPARGRGWSQLWQDTRLALRSLRHRPGFSAAVLITLALTIGPTTAIVSVGNWLLWSPSPAVADPGRLVVIWSGEWRGETSVSPSGVSYANLDDLRAASRTLVGIAGWQESGVSLAAPGLPPRHVQAGFVTANFFDVLGVRLAAGRPFNEDEDRPPYGATVTVISHSLAVQAFGSPEAALTQTLMVNGRPMTVVGVAPRAFAGAEPTSRVDVWYLGGASAYVNHFSQDFAKRYAGRADGVFYMFIGRLAPDATPATAQAELETLVPMLAQRHPEENAKFNEVRARVFQGLGPHALMRPRLAHLLQGLLVVAAVLLLLGCANVSNLLLAEGVRQQKERAVRLALGASPGRLMRQLLTESTALAITGAVLGIGLAIWLKQVIQVLLLPQVADLPTPPTVPLDSFVLSVTLGAAVGCGMVAGIVPAWAGTRPPLQLVLGREGGRGWTRRGGARAAFAIVQLALSLALVTGALLLATSLRNLSHVDLGFDPEGVATYTVDPSRHGYELNRRFLYGRSLLEGLEASRSFEAVSLSSGYPFSSGHRVRVQTPDGTADQTTSVYSVSTTSAYARVLGLRLQHGRYFTSSEVMTPSLVDGGPVVVSATLARAFFGRPDVVGQRITIPRTMSSPAREFQIVGVMEDARTRSLTGESELYLYQPMTLDQFRSWFVLLAKSGLPLARGNEIVESAARELDANMPIGEGRTLASTVGRQLANTRVLAWVLSLLGGAALLLAAAGLYGLLSQAVGERRREFGIRLAVGASAADIVQLVFRQATWILAVGAAAGLALAYWGSEIVTAYLFGVTAFDPLVYGSSVALLALVVGAGAIRPAWSATRVNPVETLRAD